MFSWWRRWRRRRILARPFPRQWQRWIDENVLHWARLKPDQRRRLEPLTQIFVAEKKWEGLNGLEVTEEIQVTIAAQACLLLLGFPDDWCFDHVLSILVHPDVYVTQERRLTEAGFVIERHDVRLGEAWHRGPVILSWKEALAGGRQETSGRNLVLHEFAHQLDFLNGSVPDGVPPLAGRQAYESWIQVMQAAFEELTAACRRGEHGVLDCYGASNPAEFFSVATESFFEEPEAMAKEWPDLFHVFLTFYGIDPREWAPAGW